MTEARPKLRLAVMTFVYEADREIAFDLLDSVVRSCGNAEIDFYLTDDGSPSHLGDKVVAWCRDAGLSAVCLRDEQNLGFRGAVYRTLRLLKAIASQPKTYDVILRIDTDALVIREGLGKALQDACRDPCGLYGVLMQMRPKDRVGFLIDLMPAGLRRKVEAGRTVRDYSFSRFRPVWWWQVGLESLLRGFRFRFVEGSCYSLGGAVPRLLLDRGLLDRYDAKQYGLITSEEDVIVTLMCTAAGLPFYSMDALDPSWKLVNHIAERVLEMPQHELPYVVHALKATHPVHQEIRAKIKQRFPLFAGSRLSASGADELLGRSPA